MNELRRMAYLEALGVDSYISRRQLPGAAVTRRLAIVSRPPAPPVKPPVIPGRVEFDTEHDRRSEDAPAHRRRSGAWPDGDSTASRANAVETSREPRHTGEPLPRFSLSAIVAGDWLWLEELDGMPLTTEQVQLMQAMAQALILCRGVKSGSVGLATGAEAAAAQKRRPDVAQFDWPMHTNRQLDLGEGAARASVAAFLARRVEQCGCKGLVLLGQSCVQRVAVEQLDVPTVSTVSSAEILTSPVLKRKVWKDLLPLLNNA